MSTQVQVLLSGLATPQPFDPGATVLLSNNGLGGEVTWLWQLLDQPEGPADAITGPTLANASIVVRKEGSYLIRLTVNAGMLDEKSGDGEILVPFTVSRQRMPAAGETTQEDPIRGWASSVNDLLALVDNLYKDSGRFVVQAGEAAMSQFTVAYYDSTGTINTGLPGEAPIPIGRKALGSSAAHMLGALAVVERGVLTTSPANGKLFVARRVGVLYAIPGAPTLRAPLYVSDAGTLDPVPGTVPRVIGQVIRVGGGTYDAYIDGSPIQRAVQSVWKFGSKEPGIGMGTEWVLPPGYTLAAILYGDQPLYRQPRAGRVSRLTCAAKNITVGNTVRVTVYWNGNPTSLTVDVNNGNCTAGVQDLDEGHAVLFDNLDKIEIHVENITNVAAASDVDGLTASLDYTPG